MRTLMVLNDPAYGTERSYNGLRLAAALAKREDADEAAAHLTDTGVGRAVLDTVPLDQRPAALAAVRDVLAEHRTPEGVHLGGAILLTTATKP